MKTTHTGLAGRLIVISGQTAASRYHVKASYLYLLLDIQGLFIEKCALVIFCPQCAVCLLLIDHIHATCL